MKKIFPILIILVLISNGCKKCDLTLGDGTKIGNPYFSFNGQGQSPRFAETGYFEQNGDLITIHASYGALLTKFTITYDSAKITDNGTGNKVVNVEPNNITYISPDGQTFTNTENTQVEIFTEKKKNKFISGQIDFGSLNSPSSGAVILLMSWGKLCHKK